MFTHSFVLPLNGVLGSCCKLRSLNFTRRGGPEPPTYTPLCKVVLEVGVLIAIRKNIVFVHSSVHHSETASGLYTMFEL